MGRIIYSVDRIEDAIAILENVDSGEIVNIDKKCLPSVSEGNILIYNDGVYLLDCEYEKKKRVETREKFNKLKRQ